MSDHTLQIAEKTIEKIKTLSLPADPPSYQLWYTYISGYNSELNNRIDRTLAISQEGAIVGTLAYLSPEQYRGEGASPASDLYALGSMMFQLLTWELPFQGPPMQAP